LEGGVNSAGVEKVRQELRGSILVSSCSRTRVPEIHAGRFSQMRIETLQRLDQNLLDMEPTASPGGLHLEYTVGPSRFRFVLIVFPLLVVV